VSKFYLYQKLNWRIKWMKVCIHFLRFKREMTVYSLEDSEDRMGSGHLYQLHKQFGSKAWPHIKKFGSAFDYWCDFSVYILELTAKGGTKIACVVEWPCPVYFGNSDHCIQRYCADRKRSGRASVCGDQPTPTSCSFRTSSPRTESTTSASPPPCLPVKPVLQNVTNVTPLNGTPNLLQLLSFLARERCRLISWYTYSYSLFYDFINDAEHQCGKCGNFGNFGCKWGRTQSQLFRWFIWKMRRGTTRELKPFLCVISYRTVCISNYLIQLPRQKHCWDIATQTYLP